MKEILKNIFDTIMLIIIILIALCIGIGIIASAALLIKWLWVTPILDVLVAICRCIIIAGIFAIIMWIIGFIIMIIQEYQNKITKLEPLDVQANRILHYENKKDFNDYGKTD